MADVFISYARENAPLVRQLADAVKQEGYSVWWDDALPPHLSYSDVITGEIGKAKAVIVVWSETAIASEWVRAEADLARNRKKLVQTSIDGRMPPMPFNQLHFVSIGDWRGEADHPGWAGVKESLASLCRGEAVQPAYAFPSTPPPRPARPAPGDPMLRLALIVVGGLILLGAAGAAAFWLTGGQSVPTASEVPSQGTQPRLSAPVEESRPIAPPPATAAPRPAAPAALAPVRVQSDKPKAGSTLAMTMRRYCSGPGRGTPQCRQLRARMNAAR